MWKNDKKMLSIKGCRSDYIDILYQEKLVSFVWWILPNYLKKDEILLAVCILLYLPSVDKIYEGLEQE